MRTPERNTHLYCGEIRFPVFNLQAIDPTKLSRVVGYQDELMGQGDRGNLQIVGSD